ncbi:CbtA family protein [Halovivax limisalsi]|uniref:CbtA family protein n=1 Tax=Halovivax limisalsi TaxID=1453760 RepID=UPI001FFD40B3|nr:CbtA family protein [Halovivax limisalsi]
MLETSLKRGVLAGLVAGIPYGLYVALVASPLLGYVEAVGGSHGHEHVHGDGHAGAAEHAGAVSDLTGTIVSAAGGVLWAILLASALAVAYFVLEPALPGRGAVKAFVLGAAGFVSLSVVPWLVLPPTAPGAAASVGVDARLAIYAGLVGVGLLTSGAAIVGYRRVRSRGRLPAVAVALLPVCLVMGTLAAAAPTIVSQPAVDAALLAAVQGAAAVSQGALWAGIAGAYAGLSGVAACRPTATTEYDVDRRPAPEP